MNFHEQYAQYQTTVEQALSTFCAHADTIPADGGAPYALANAMRYSLLSGGKRLRPVLLLASAEVSGAEPPIALAFACAIEMVHTYSLIHDDLPGMDDDALRRGRPTNHVVYGTGMAVLAGDGLLNAAFEQMLNASFLLRGQALQNAVRAMREVAARIGIGGMIAGQAVDLTSERQAPDEARLLYLRQKKTADLLTAAVLAGQDLGGASETARTAFERFCIAFGHAFQIQDDCLDVLGHTSVLGKQVGQDAAHGKLTAVAMHGLAGAQAEAEDYTAQAIDALLPLGERAMFFMELAKTFQQRVR